MKRRNLVLFLGVCLLLFWACEKKDTAGAAPQGVQAAPVITAICPIQGLSTYQPKEGSTDEFVKFNRYLEYGEAVSLLNEEIDGKTGEYSMRFQKIKDKDGKELWVNQRYLIPSGKTGVIIQDNVLLYSEAALTKNMSSLLSKGQLIGVYPETEGPFSKITGWNEQLYGFAQLYVKSEAVSTNENDVTALILIERAKKEKNAIIKAQVLESAADLNSQVFNDDIYALLDELAVQEAQAAAAIDLPERNTEPLSASATIISDNVRVRDYPYEENTNVLATLSTGTAISITEKTVSTYTIGSDTAVWYKISEPEGWVFGAFVELK